MGNPSTKQIVINANGVHYRLPNGKYEVIAPWIEYTARIKVDQASGKFDALSFMVDGTQEEVIMTPADFHSAAKWRTTLLNSGYNLPQDRSLIQLIHEHLIHSRPRLQRLLVHSVGWHGDTFVLPGIAASNNGVELAFHEAPNGRTAAFGERGTLEGWKSGVAVPAAASSRLVLSIALAFAAPLLRFTNFDSCGLHLEGESSKGKTTCLLAATSVSRKADRRELLTWDATKAGLAEMAMAHNDNLMCIDELANSEGNVNTLALRMREMAYMLASGRGRLRSSVYGLTLNLNDARWRLLFLSSGERAISDLATEAAIGRMKGEEVRLIDLPAVVTPGLGIYEHLPDGVTSPAALSESIEAACQEHHGIPIQMFVTKVGKHAVTMPETVNRLIGKFMNGAQVPSGGWERRFARPFALSYAAAFLASEFGILPWSPPEIARAIKACYLAARARVPDAGIVRDEAMARLCERLGDTTAVLSLDRRGTKISWTPEQARTHDIFLTAAPSRGRYFLVKPSAFSKWFNSVESALVLDWLDQTGQLIVDKDRRLRTIQASVRGIEGRSRYYAIKRTVLDTGS